MSVDHAMKPFDVHEFLHDPKIYHYAAHVKPWLDIRVPDDGYYWKYVRWKVTRHWVRTINGWICTLK